MNEQGKIKELEVVTLNISQGEFLSEALKRQGYPCLPSNTIINKVMTGTGATYMELNQELSPRNSIVIEPFRSSVDDKIKIFDESLGVFKEVTQKQVETYLQRKDIKYKKIITTPEGFKKILSAAKKAKINLYEEFFCLFDESDHITQDTGYRRSISAPMAEFFKFKNKALVSATPIRPSKYTIKLFLRNKFKWMNIKPDYPYQEDMTLIATRSFYKCVREKIKELLNDGSAHVCIFYKTTEGLRSIMEDLMNNNIINDSEYKVFCSQESASKLKGKFLEHSTEKLELPLPKVSGFTSRFFPSVDINLSKLCDVLILSNYEHVDHSLIDPFTEAIQCQGRFRHVFPNNKRYNSLTVISSIPEDLTVKTPEIIDSDVRTRIKSYRAVKREKANTIDPDDIEFYDKELKKMRLALIMDSSQEQIDRFAIEQLANAERVKSYYLSSEYLKKAYEDTNYFNVNFIPDDEAVGDDDIHKLNAATTKNKYKLIVNMLERIGTNEAALKLLRAKCVEEEWLINSFVKLGRSVIEDNKYSKAKIEKLLHESEVEEGKSKRFSPQFMEDICSEFTNDIGQDYYISVNSVLDRIAYLLKVHGITYTRYGDGKSSNKVMCKLTADTINEYFDTNISNRKGASSVKLTRLKEDQVKIYPNT